VEAPSTRHGGWPTEQQKLDIELLKRALYSQLIAILKKPKRCRFLSTEVAAAAVVMMTTTMIMITTTTTTVILKLTTRLILIEPTTAWI